LKVAKDAKETQKMVQKSVVHHKTMYGMGYGVLFHLGCLWTLTFSGVGGGVFMYGGFICKFVVICSSFVSRLAMNISMIL
jgi:hypothetical protein